MFVDEAYFTIPAEEQIDKWAPLLSIGLFVLATLSPLLMLAYALATKPEGAVIQWDVVWKAVLLFTGAALAICFFVLVLMGGLASVGVLVAAGIMKFPKPSGVFKKCAAALSFPMMLHLLIAGIASAAGTRGSLARGGTGVAHSGGSLRTRHHWRKTARQWAAIEARETERYDEIASPIRERLQADLSSAELLVGHLEVQVSTREQWLDLHPELEVRLAAIDRELDPTPTIQERLQALEVESPGPDLGLGREL
jgi:hypothetical protein